LNLSLRSSGHGNRTEGLIIDLTVPGALTRHMKVLLVLPLLIVLGLAGCSHKQESAVKPTPGATGAATSGGSTSPTTATNLIVTPDGGLTGKVVSYNDAGRFVVLEFPVGHLPIPDQHLFVYRNGLKVGEVKVTTWQRDVYIVADLTNGEARAGDEVRDK